MSETECKACAGAAEPAFYQSNCMQCEARALAQSPEAHKRESDPSGLQAAIRKMWPDEADYRKGRALVWEHIGRLEAPEANQ